MFCCETAPESVAHRSRHIKDILHTTMAKRGYELHPLNKSGKYKVHDVSAFIVRMRTAFTALRQFGSLATSPILVPHLQRNMVIVPTTETRTTYMQHSFLHTVIPNLPSSAATSVSLPMFKYLVSQLYFTIVSRVHLVLALVLFVYPCNSAELSLKKGARKCELNHKALQPTVGLLLHHPMHRRRNRGGQGSHGPP